MPSKLYTKLDGEPIEHYDDMCDLIGVDTALHFYRWMLNTVFPGDYGAIEAGVYGVLREAPELAGDRTWQEIRRLAGV